MLIGKVGKSYGILGWVTIFSFTEKKEKIFNYLPWFFFKKEWMKIEINRWKKHNNNFIVLIKGISNRSEAKKITNSDIIVSKNTLPVLKKNEYYWHDIINYKVFNKNQNYLGEVIDLIRTKSNDILIVKNALEVSKKKILIPFINDKIIKYVDTNKKFIIVQWK